jgi:predicted transcriptional regulator
MAETVRIKPETHAKLRELAGRTGETLPELLEKAVEAFRRKQFLVECNRAYQALKSDPKAWAEELKERETWEATLLDGLQEDGP